MQIRVRLAAGLASIAGGHFLNVDLAEGATVADLMRCVADTQPDVAPTLASTLPVIAGQHAARSQVLEHRQEVALLLPVSGG